METLQGSPKGYVFINLLPYREKNKKEKLKKVITYLSMFGLVSATLLVLAYSYISYEIDNQKSRNVYIEKENKKLDNKITEIAELKESIKQTLEKRKVVEVLQLNRGDAVNLLNNLANLLPDGTSIKSVQQKLEEGRDKITIVGITQSNNKVSAYMTSLEVAGYLNPSLVETKAIQVKTTNSKVVTDTTYNEFTIFVYLPKYEINDGKDGKETTDGKGENDGSN